MPNIAPEIAIRPTSNLAGVRTRLEAELRAWCEEEQADWDAQITGDEAGSDLWGSMPTVDSKTVARMAPIFERHLGRFNVRDIRPGGYSSIDEVIQHLVLGR